MAVESFVQDDDCVPLTGAGGTAPSLALLVRPRSVPEAARAVLGRGARGVVARGHGGTCGDAAQNAGGTVLDLTGLDRIQGLDATAGVVVCEAGTGLDRLARALLPHGWQPPLDLAGGLRPAGRRGPGTVGGALASGGLAGRLRSLELLTADGSVRTVRPGDPLCDATTGGLGLTGVILSATLALRPVETAYLRDRATGFRDADALLAHWTGDAPGERHARAWVELSGRGRAVLTTAEPVPYDGLPRGHRARRDPLAPPRSGGAGGLRPLPGLARAHALLPSGLRALSALPAPAGTATGPGSGPGHVTGTSAGRSRPTGPLAALGGFGLPLPGLPGLPGAPGPVGPFVRYRCAVPEGREEALRGILALLAHRRSPARAARHARVERVHADGTGPLAFPVRGWCLALDVPAGARGLGPFLDLVDERVAAAGGRVCLAEDARLRPALLPVMYPRLDAFRELRAAHDPRSVFRSDLARRLGVWKSWE
ncbi:FAD-binding protein [Streptomyces omiyaensis]|uniref:FAD-binding protein n=1 Tax=Streptomyces omiyaensis TaxID=68247 RepID=UPI0036FAFC9B